MFGKNEKQGKQHFKDVGDRLLVTSMFMTLQGEGPLRGEPAFFIRLAKCNLDCSFCDTYFDSGDWLTLDEVGHYVNQKLADFFGPTPPTWLTTNSYQYGNKKRVAFVVSGGEPTLQPNLKKLLEWASLKFWKTQIESNGLLPADIPSSTILVISPKCLEEDSRAVRYMSIHRRNLDRADCLKFVMTADPFSPYFEVPSWAHKWARETGRPVFISPMNIYLREPQKAREMRARNVKLSIDERSTVDEVVSFWEPGLLDMRANEANHVYAANYAIRNGFIFNVQQQLLAAVA